MKTNQNSAAGQLGTAVRQSQIKGFLNQINIDLDNLDKALAIHGERIADILRAGDDLKSGAISNQPAPEEPLCAIADALRTYSRRIISARQRVEELTERNES